MAGLNTQPGSISPAQRRALFGAARKRGMDRDQLRAAAGGSVSGLSRSRASQLIETLCGAQLTNPPGQAPPPPRRPGKPGVIRMITDQQIEQIARLMTEAFESPDVGYRWLERDFKVRRVRDLATAQRAGQVIYVLKLMTSRKDSRCTSDGSTD